jgi:hypothetical protein
MDTYFNIIGEIYNRFNKNNIPNISALLEKYSNNEIELIKSLLVKYSANPVDFDFFRNYIDRNFQEYLSAFYTKFNPEKLGEIENIVEKYKDRKVGFVTQLAVKYNLQNSSLIDFIDFQKIEVPANHFNHEIEKTVKVDVKTSDPPPVNKVNSLPQPKNRKKYILIVVVIFALVGVGVYFAYINYIRSQKTYDRPKMEDSVRMADSISKFLTQNQRTKDSLQLVEMGEESELSLEFLTGIYTGQFGDNILIINIESISNDGVVVGFNELKGKRRLLSGKVTNGVSEYLITLIEPGDDKWDGVFTCKATDSGEILTGEWASNNGKLTRKFTLMK